MSVFCSKTCILRGPDFKIFFPGGMPPNPPSSPTPKFLPSTKTHLKTLHHFYSSHYQLTVPQKCEPGLHFSQGRNGIYYMPEMVTY